MRQRAGGRAGSRQGAGGYSINFVKQSKKN